MYPAGKHPIFPYSEEERIEIIKESGLDEERVKEDVEIILEWFNKQPHLADAGINKRTVELTIFGSKGSLERTKKKLDTYYRLKYYSPEIIQDRKKILSDPNADLYGSYLNIPIPKLYKGNRISLMKFTNPDDPEITQKVLINSFMVADIRVVNDFMAGDIWVVDAEGVGMKQAVQTNWSIVQKAAKIIQQGTNLRISGIHVINCSVGSIVQFVMNVLKQILSPKVFGRIKIHNSLEELHKEIPKEYLPKDYGGDLPSSIEMKEKLEKFFKSDETKQYLMDCCKLVSDESKRIKDEYSDEFITGTFKQLNFD